MAHNALPPLISLHQPLVWAAVLLVPSLGWAGQFSNAQVCRATVAALMGHPPAIVRVTRTVGDVVHTTYKRPGDGTVWANRCKQAGTTVVWATETGRWRTDPADERVSFAEKADTLTITQTFTDGSSLSKTYTRKDLR